MVKRSPSRPSSAADELAAKLRAITEAATGLWRAGVVTLTVDGVTASLQEPPAVPKPRSEEDVEADDPLSLAAYRRSTRRKAGEP
ncbi:MAG: hypothetical protein AAB262_09195 [Elusimicrobiota bacterium]